MERRFRLFALSLVIALAGCTSETAPAPTESADDHTAPNIDEAPDADANRIVDAGPEFCGQLRPSVIEAAFTYKIRLASVSVAMEKECHYELDAPGTEYALLIYRMQPIEMFEGLRGSRRQTGEVPNLGEEAILLGDAQVAVRIDSERAVEVAVQLMNMSDEPLPLTPEETTEGIVTLARLLAVKL